MMKKYLMAFCLAAFVLAPINVFAVTWNTNYKKAVQDAAKNHKHILLFFTGSNWCGWCKKMHQEVFSSPEFDSQVGNAFIFVEVDFPTNRELPPETAQQNMQLKQKYEITGYPTVVILDANENFIAETGYRSGGAKAFAEYLRQLLQ